jgi:hypothetical protein
MANKLPMPMSSWPMLKQIIRAYGQVQDVETPTVDAVAEYANVHRSVVSSNNNFLREIGIVSREENKPTPLGANLAATLVMENDTLIAEALQDVVRAHPSLNQWVGMVRARGSMKVEHLKGIIALAGNVTDKTKQSVSARAIIDLLQESKLIQVNDDTVKAGSPDSTKASEEEMKITEHLLNAQNRHANISLNPTLGQETASPRIPLPLGPSRLAYIQLPEDWQPKELSKLIKILQIALGDDSEGT